MNEIHQMSYKGKTLLVLLFGTILVIWLYYQFGDTQRLVILSDQYTYTATDDRPSGGKSVSKLLIENKHAHLECELKQSEYAWPYCSLSIQLSNGKTNGIDLSDYHTLKINVDYQTDDPDARIRVYLRNYNSAYSKPDNGYTAKYNGLEFAPGYENGTFSIPMKNFQVMTWWLADLNIDIAHAAPEFNNVVLLEIATGAHAKLGSHNISINSIEFEGYFINGEKLMLALVLIWIGLGVAVFWSDHVRTRKAISQANTRHFHLKKVNETLLHQNNKFAEMAQIDALTGANNRHSVRSWLDSEVKRDKSEENMAMIYLDIDHFKKINDTFGHKVGDDILKEYVLVVSTMIRPTDHLVRWGGEEFIVFCRETNLTQAYEIAERILSNVRDHIWLHGELLTCSAGVAEMVDEKMTETMVRADEALYQAKRKGRDRVEVNRRVFV